jgi:hypothetical protein
MPTFPIKIAPIQARDEKPTDTTLTKDRPRLARFSALQLTPTIDGGCLRALAWWL